MIELKSDNLIFTFPEVHPQARLSINLQRTLRIPDDGESYPLPPGLGSFPLKHVDDFAVSVPRPWLQRGGVMLPMYQSEALWLFFQTTFIEDRDAAYPFALKVAAGKINAVTGAPWDNRLERTQQDYVVAPTQPWLDGYCVEQGLIRQFVAMPLGSGYSAEEQITGAADHGGLQLVVYPMKKEVFEKRFPRKPRRRQERSFGVMHCRAAGAPDMGLAPGGLMKQEVFEDPYGVQDWDTDHSSRCFVHIANSLVWRAITGEEPPTTPPTANEYTAAGLPWFDYLDESATALDGPEALANLHSVADMSDTRKDGALPENEPVTPKNVVKLRQRLKRNEVREGVF